VHFSISSISKPTLDVVAEGYYKQEDLRAYHLPTRTMIRFKRLVTFCREYLSPTKEYALKMKRSASPLVDPEFLLFALLVAEHMHRGYEVGHVGGAGAFVPYSECSLSSFVPNTISLDGRYTLCITPHKHHVEVGDIPEYARLLKLKRLTRDVSLAALFNRLALWLYLFVQVYHYGWKIVLCHPRTGERKELTSIFFSKFSVGMAL
jgi:hypothetical protein